MTFTLPELNVFAFPVKEGEEVTGLFIDPTTTRPPLQRTIGATFSPNDQAGERNHYPCMVPNFRSITSENLPMPDIQRVFVSRASLADVKSIQVQRVGNRCTGLCIQHTSGPFETLGQWNPSDTCGISLLFARKAADQQLKSLTFIFSDTTNRHYVEDIVIGESPSI